MFIDGNVIWGLKVRLWIIWICMLVIILVFLWKAGNLLVFIAFIVLFFYTNIVIVFFVLRRRFWYLLERYLLNRFFPLGFFLIPSIWVLLGSIVSFGRSKFVNMFGDPLFFYTRNNWSLDLNFNFYRKYMLDNKLLYLSYSLGSYKLVLYRNNDWRLYKTSYCDHNMRILIWIS